MPNASLERYIARTRPPICNYDFLVVVDATAAEASIYLFILQTIAKRPAFVVLFLLVVVRVIVRLCTFVRSFFHSLSLRAS